MMADTLTRLWRRYDAGRDYNARLKPNLYRVVETNTEFFNDNQWLGLPDTPAVRALPKPVFNILKRIATLFISSLSDSSVTLRAETLSAMAADRESTTAADSEAETLSHYANAVLDHLLEKLDFQYKLRDALYDGAITGDFAAHFWFDPDARSFYPPCSPLQRGANGKSPAGMPPLIREDTGGFSGEIRMELIPGIDVMFGNPNDRAVENQPYILIVGRDMVSNLRAEARQNRRHGGAPERIRADNETADFPGSGGQTELSESNMDDGPVNAEDTPDSGKALYLICYEKQRNADGQISVHATKATKNGFVYWNVDTGLAFYPLAWGNWEKRKFQYHGAALLTGLLPGQIFINTMYATAMRHLQLTAFPKTIYNADLISSWNNEPGGAIAVRGLQPGQTISNAAAHLQPGNLSAQVGEFLDRTISFTKECAGVTDILLGQARPENTSALKLLQENSRVPLENIRHELCQWTEDVGRILLDFVGTYYGRRWIGGKSYDFSAFKNLWFHLRVDAAPAQSEADGS